MNYETFMETLKNELQKQLGTDVQITTGEITKNNGMLLHSIIIQNETSNLSPCIYVDNFFESYQNGAIAFHDIVLNIIQLYQQNIPTHNFDTGIVLDYTLACAYIRGHLINTEKNADLLKSIPHREFLDLSLIYSIDLPNIADNVQGSIRINHRHMEMWGITEHELYEQSKKNMELLEEGMVENLSNIFCECTPELASEHIPLHAMYSLTNKSKYYGAVQMLNTNLLKSVSDMFCSDMILLPSSIHEMLLLPVCKETENVNHLAEIVESVNNTHLEPNEILSYHVYRYDRKTGNISIVA